VKFSFTQFVTVYTDMMDLAEFCRQTCVSWRDRWQRRQL